MSDTTPLATNLLPRHKSADALGFTNGVSTTSPGDSIPGMICKTSKDGFFGYGGDVARSLSNDYYSDDDDSDDIDGDNRRTSRKYSGDIINVTRAPKDGSFDLCGSMYKRRGGLGRNAENKW